MERNYQGRGGTGGGRHSYPPVGRDGGRGRGGPPPGRGGRGGDRGRRDQNDYYGRPDDNRSRRGYDNVRGGRGSGGDRRRDSYDEDDGRNHGRNDERGRHHEGQYRHSDGPRRGDDRDRRGRNDDDYYGRGRDNHRDRRRDDDYYGRHDSRDDRMESDWKCQECSVWNYPNEHRCVRCGFRRSDQENDDSRRRRHHRSGSSGSSASGGSDNLDEFGRPRNKSKSKVKKDPEWPPSFASNSDAFVLDARSGMFYHAESDFFYDPTSKLYYGNKKHAYFEYDVETKKFLPVNDTSKPDGEGVLPAPPAGSAGAMDQDELLLVPNGANNLAGAAPAKKAIAINLKPAIPTKSPAKKRKKRSDSTSGPGDATKKQKEASGSGDTGNKAATKTPTIPANKVNKQHAANLEKWAERGKEKQLEAGGFQSKLEAAAASGQTSTKDGKPICWVCKRKFPSLDKLRLHEEKSDLHKNNLAKQKQEQEQREKEAASKKAQDAANAERYVDRAQHRRDMYGPDLVLPTGPDVPAAISPVVEVATMTPGDAPANNNTNIGHDMLQKLGWKAGGSLGRGNERQQEQQAALAKDWDRIENLAAQNQSQQGRRR